MGTKDSPVVGKCWCAGSHAVDWWKNSFGMDYDGPFVLQHRWRQELSEITSPTIDTPAPPGTTARRGVPGRETRGKTEWLAWICCGSRERKRRDIFLPSRQFELLSKLDRALGFKLMKNELRIVVLKCRALYYQGDMGTTIGKGRKHISGWKFVFC